MYAISRDISMKKYHFDENTKELSISGKKIDFHTSRYNLETEIGHGANGFVLKGYDSSFDRTVAIKFWLPYRDNTLPDYNKYNNEIKKIAQFTSNKIVTIYDTGEIENDYYYATYEFIQGESLRKWLHSKPDFSLRCIVLEQIYYEMEKIHKSGIYHGDLHQENILITSSCDVKIIDFGTSFHSGQEESQKRETRLLLDTGLSILEEDNKNNFLDKDCFKDSSPECVPPSILILSKVIQELNRLDNTPGEYTKQSIAFGVAVFICESPVFILENVLKFLQESVMDDTYINWFVGAVFSNCQSNIGNEPDSYPIENMKVNDVNIKLLKEIYLKCQDKYLSNFKKGMISDN